MSFTEAVFDFLLPAAYPEAVPAFKADTVYGIKWAPGVVSALQAFRPPVPAGIYVVFKAETLSHALDPFGRYAGPGPVYSAPNQVPARLQGFVKDMGTKAPPSQRGYFNGVTDDRLEDLDGFITYVSGCLDLVNKTDAGRTLVGQLGKSKHAVTISPANEGNGTGLPDEQAALTKLAQNLWRCASYQPPDRTLLEGLLGQKYPAESSEDRYGKLAEAVKVLPLYSLFVVEGAFLQGWLGEFMKVGGSALTGRQLQEWVEQSTEDHSPPALNRFLRGTAASEGVEIRTYFLTALALVLHGLSDPGEGSPANISFNVRNEGWNSHADPNFRPPAVGLAHELVHALHGVSGTSIGTPIWHWSTVLARLLATGITPFDREPVTENAVRTQWHSVASPDASNQWSSPQRRNVFQALVSDEQLGDVRKQARTP